MTKLMDLPDGWQWKKLGEAAQINPRPSKLRQDEDLEVSFIPMKCVKEESGEIDLSEIKPYKDVKKGFTSFENGDVIFAKITPCMENGKIAVVENLKNGVGFGSTEFHVFRCSPILNNKLLFYFLLQKSFRDEAKLNFAGAVGQQRVPKQFLENYLIPIPPLNTQQKIVSKIDAAFTLLDEAIERQKQNIQRGEDLKKAVLKEVFGEEKWDKKNLMEVVALISGQHIETSNYNENGLGFPYLTGPSDFGDLHPIVTRWTAKPKVFAKNEDTLLTVKGSGVGKVNYCNIENLVISRQIMAVRPTKIDSKFLFWFLKNSNSLLQSLKKGAGIPGITREDVLTLQISVPTITEQKKITTHLHYTFSKVDESLKAQMARLRQLEDLKKSILSEAFRGQL